MEDTGEIHVLVIQEVVQVEPVTILEKLWPMLDEFKEIISEELPHGLPLIWDIQHHIDLVPGSNWPNPPHYWMSLKESQILQKQVDDLM